MNRPNIHKTTFDKTFTYLHLYRASIKAKRNVGWKNSVQKYNAKRNIYLSITLTKLRNGTYKSKGFYSFTKVERGKPRLIRSNHISERVVQKTLCDYYLTPLLRKKTIYDNGATLSHKGCEFVINRAKLFARKCDRLGKPIYFLTTDFHSYFDNINHEILLKAIRRYCFDDKLFVLITHFIKCFGNKGLGLGSQVSQICAIFYTHEIDNLIKHELRFKYYVRYMDDSLIISDSKEKLQYALKRIKEVCIRNDIILNESKTLISKNRCSFLKRQWINVASSKRLIVKPNKDSYYRMFRKIKIFMKWKMPLENIETSFQSWRSHFMKDNAKILVNKANIKYNNLKENYYDYN